MHSRNILILLILLDLVMPGLLSAQTQPLPTSASLPGVSLPASQPSEGFPNLPKELTLDWEGGMKMELVLIPPGTFLMGSPENEKDRDKDEGPQHRVTITKPFYMGKYEVTQAQWKTVMEKKWSHFTGDGQLPVENVLWDDAQDFCKKLSKLAGSTVRLPSEAEWEYACRAGTTTRFSYGDDLQVSLLEKYAWFDANSDSRTHPVGQRKPNAWGLYDMHGNVREWCQDWHHEGYAGAPADGSAWKTQGDGFRVLRGGSWDNGGCWFLRSASRFASAPCNAYDSNGFRVVVECGKTPFQADIAAALKQLEAAVSNQNAVKAYAALAALKKVAPTHPDLAKWQTAVDRLGPVKTLALDLGGGVTMELVLISPGTFLMGSPENEQDRHKDEGPQHRVTFAKPFYMGKFEVTRAQWQAVMGNDSNRSTGDGNLPVEGVSWKSCQEFCQRVSIKTGRNVRLPSVAEWEYACRAGTTTRFSFGNDPDYSLLGEYAWFDANSDSHSHPVGQKKPNAFGLYDMHGNVWEWCQDWYHQDYTGAPTDRYAWETPKGDYRALRGGCWYSRYPTNLRSANNYWSVPNDDFAGYGFRVTVEVWETP